MSEVNQETLERFVSTAEQLLAALPVLAGAMATDTSTSMINYSEVVGYGDSSDPSITHLPEIVSYEQVYQIKTNDWLVGGLNGIANLQARALIGRTNYLKKVLEALTARVDEIDALPDSDESRYSEILQQLRALDVSVFKRQISQLERQNMSNAIAMKNADMVVDENDIIVEVFRNSVYSAVDRTNAEVVSVILGDDSVDIADAKNLITGGVYQLTDGETSEEVQIKENLGAIENGWRILFVNDVAHNYKNGRARLYRSSTEITEGRAYGGGILREKTWNANIDFAGTSSSETISAALDFSNGAGFELSGAVVDSNGQIVLGEESVGIALTESGWVQVDAEGDDVNV